MERVYLTRQGYEKLIQELEYLKNVERRKIAKALEQARLLGDLRENAEYDSAKEAQAKLEQRIAELEDKLSRAEIIDEAKIDKDKAYIGAKLKVLDLDTNQEEEYTLVDPEEADPAGGRISINSPVGKAFLGHKVGDEIQVEVPAGVLRYKIIQIWR